MNIFFLDQNPNIAAQMHCDKHVVKMILESAQLLSTAHRVLDGSLYIDRSSGRSIQRWKLNDNREHVLYKATHVNHPSAVWVRQSIQNYNWLYELFHALTVEYGYRYAKHHQCESMLHHLMNVPNSLIANDFTEVPQAMPDYCKVQGDSVQAYRNYYVNEKLRILKYTKRQIPNWIE